MGLSQTASAKWKRRNKERVKSNLASWLEKNRERRLRYMREYNARNKERQRVYDAERYLRPENISKRIKNRDAKKFYMEQWFERNPEYKRVAHAKRKARKFGTSVGDLAVIRRWVKKWKSRKSAVCHWCLRRTPVDKCHVDHIVPLRRGGAHSIENLCISCESCNRHKQGRTVEFWNRLIDQPTML